MRRYLEAFFRHPRLLAAPIAVGLIVGILLVAVQPREYQATAKVWFQTNSIAGVSDPTRAVQTPAQVAEAMFQELVGSRSFCVAIGHRGPLASYMSSGHMPSTDPISTAMGYVNDLRHPPNAQSKRQVLDDAIVDLLQHKVGVAATGPEIVTVTFNYPNATIAAATLKALLEQFSDDLLATQRAQVNQQVGFYQQQVEAQQQVVTTANTAVNDYLSKHPNLSASNTAADPTLASLQQVASQAQQQFAEVIKQLNGAKLQQKNLTDGDPSQFRTIDQPIPPPRPVSFTKQLLMGAGGGLVVGLVITLLALVVMTILDRSVRTEEQAEQALGLRVIGSIPWRAPTIEEPIDVEAREPPPSGAPPTSTATA